MAGLTSRDRLLTALRHSEPDRVPYDLASTQVTGISAIAYANLRKHLGMTALEPQICDQIQQVCAPHDDMMERLGVDTRGLFPLTSHNWNVVGKDEGEYLVYADEWGLTHRMPKHGGFWYSLYRSPIEDTTLTAEAVDKRPWPDPRDPRRIEGLRAQAEAFRAQGKAVFMMDLVTSEAAAVHLMRKALEIKVAFWDAALEELGDVVDVVAETDDYGTQESMLISPKMFRSLLKPLLAELLGAVREKLGEDGFIFFHSCGNVRELIPDFIELGVDILNPVHIAAAGMEPAALKRDFGKDICFWGGGVETQRVLPTGAPEQVREDVKKNLAALAPGGGYVFNTVHNIQPEVPPQNIIAMWEALREFGRY